MKFDVILADPPWNYSDKSLNRGGAARHYSTMTVEQIKRLPVADIAADNAALFLWATWPTLPDAMQVITAWGFRYKTCAFVWVKTTSNGKHAIGMGHYTRANSEPCLLATRGRMPVASRAVRQVIEAQRLEHSQKPAEAQARIEQLYPEARRAELFARQSRIGWAAFGDAVDGQCLSSSLVFANDNRPAGEEVA